MKKNEKGVIFYLVVPERDKCYQVSTIEDLVKSLKMRTEV